MGFSIPLKVTVAAIAVPIVVAGARDVSGAHNPVAHRSAAVTPPSVSVVVALSTGGKKNGRGWLDVGSLGGGLRRLTPQPPEGARTIDEHPAWSPDGKSIAFVRSDGRNAVIYTIPREGGSPVAIATFASSAYLPYPNYLPYPVWSADGSKLVFDRFRGVECQRKKAFRLRFTVATIGGGLRDFAALPRPRRGVVLAGESWSPDDAHLLYSILDFYGGPREGHAGEYEDLLYVIDANGHGRRLLARRYVIGYPTWSPDGRRIAYVSDCDAVNGGPAHVIGIDGKQRRALKVNGCALDLAWEPDGSALLVSDPGGLRRIELASGRRKTIARWPSNTGPPDGFLGVSPDGRWLAVMGDDESAPIAVTLIPLTGGASVTYGVRPETPGQ